MAIHPEPDADGGSRRYQPGELLDKLEGCYGAQASWWPDDPYSFLVWWHCGYPASDAACAKGWESLNRRIGIEPEQLLAASQAELREALKPGGVVPELRARRLQQIAERVQKEFGGNLSAALRAMPAANARKALKKFPNIADGGADRIVLFAGISPEPAVPSNCPHVLVRIMRGREKENYGRTYAEAQGIIQAEVPARLDARRRAYLLLKQHGQTICKRTNPKCGACPLADRCAYVQK
jgi:endonuclease III